MPTRAVFLLLTAIVLVGGVPAHAQQDLALDIAYDAPGSADGGGPALAVTFADARTVDGGGGDPLSFGTLKSSTSRRIVHSSGVPLETFLVGYVADALGAAGFAPRPGAEPGLPRLHVTLRTLMAAGFTHFEVPLQADLEVFAPGGDSPLWSGTLASSGGVMLVASPQELVEAYDEALAAGLRKLDATFGGAEFAAAIRGEAPVAEADARDALPVDADPDPDPAVPPPPPLAPIPPEPPVPPLWPPPPGMAGMGSSGDPAGGIHLAQITDETEFEASGELEAICLTDLVVEFEFLGQRGRSEWTLIFIDEDRDRVGYVNLDDEETLEFDGDDEDIDPTADAGEPHRARIRVEGDEVDVHIDGHEVLDDEDLDDPDGCLRVEVLMDRDMVLTDFVVRPLTP